MRLILLGPPGAGKGTQAELLKKRLDLRHISSGDMFREEVKAGTELGKEARKYMEAGKLIPDDIVIRMVSGRIKGIKAGEGFALDGFPRTRVQAENLDKILRELAKPIDRVLYLETSTPVVIRRLGGRRVCRECGLSYHVDNMLPKKEGICDQCGGRLYQRPDDSEATIQVRLKAYEDQTAELVEYYRLQGILRKVPGDYEAEKLFDYLEDFFRKEDLI